MTPYMVVYASKVANTRYWWCTCVKGTPSQLAQTIGFTVNASWNCNETVAKKYKKVTKKTKVGSSADSNPEQQKESSALPTALQRLEILLECLA